ncbi:MAG: SDR family NAD(P)-dependent oxidoreductase, partial [Desulfobacteraceae bacterium]|nr:SDR family NAD(P)-dependent oxidoreductase [Desulfobacteraceae bacterium]
GFGEACARLFAVNGYKIIITGRREKNLNKLENELKNKTDVLSITMDVRIKDKVFSQIENIPEKFSEIDVLVNNAGLALGLEPAYEADIGDWDQMVDTNIKGLMYLSRAILPGMVKRQKGHIVNIGSIAGTYPYPGGNTYGASKAFVKQFSRNLRSDLLGTGINVTNIEPGIADTEFSKVRFHGDQEKADSVYTNTLPLVAQDIAETVFWSVSRPSHVNINSIEVMPTCQACGPLAIHRENKG